MLTLVLAFGEYSELSEELQTYFEPTLRYIGLGHASQTVYSAMVGKQNDRYIIYTKKDIKYVPFDELAAAVEEFKGYENPVLDYDVYDNYGDTVVDIFLAGYKAITNEEDHKMIDSLIKKQENQETALSKTLKQQKIEQAKKLLKEEGLL